MRVIRILPIMLAPIVLANCAMNPESVAPAYISEMSYMSYSCAQLASEQTRIAAALSTASDAQRTARSNDTLGVLLIGLPVSSLSGANQASNIGRLKGELEAIQKAGSRKGCNLPSISDPSTKKKSETQRTSKRTDRGPGIR